VRAKISPRRSTASSGSDKFTMRMTNRKLLGWKLGKWLLSTSNGHLAAKFCLKFANGKNVNK